MYTCTMYNHVVGRKGYTMYSVYTCTCIDVYTCMYCTWCEGIRLASQHAIQIDDDDEITRVGMCG